MFTQLGQSPHNPSSSSIIKLSDARQREMLIKPSDVEDGRMYVSLRNSRNPLIPQNILKFDSLSFHTFFECIEQFGYRGQTPKDPINVKDDDGKILQISSPSLGFLCFEIMRKNLSSGHLDPVEEDSKLFIERHAAKDLIETLKDHMPQCDMIWNGVVLNFKKFIRSAQEGHTPYADDRYQLKNPSTLQIIERRSPSPFTVQAIQELSARTGHDLYPVKVPYGTSERYGLAYDLHHHELPNFGTAVVSPRLRSFAKQS